MGISRPVNVYCISGLGVDRRMFAKLQWPDTVLVHHIEWILPEPRESLTAYALRLSEQVDKTKPFILLGLSFGGIIASELAELFNPLKVIIVSSIRTRKELPWYYRFAGKLRLHKLVPLAFLKSANFFSYWLFGASCKEARLLLKAILADTNDIFTRWAINEVVCWQRTKAVSLRQIHGAADHILPQRYTRPDVSVPGGGHLMVYVQADLISLILKDILSEENMPVHGLSL